MKIFKQILLAILILTLLIVVTLEFGAPIFYKSSDLNSYERAINTSSFFPKVFYDINDKLFSDRELNIRMSLFNTMGGHKNRTSYDFKVAKLLDTSSSRFLFAKLVLAFHLSRKAGVLKCYDYYTGRQLENCCKWDSTLKTTMSLNDTFTVLKFLAIRDAPRLYLKHPDRILNKIEYFQQQLKE